MFRAFDPGSDATRGAGAASAEPAAERLVAVKLFRIDLAPERVHQLVAELERLIAAELAHPAIASPLAAGIVGAQAYLVSEFVAADSLDIVIRDNGPAPIGHALKVAAQLAGALDYAAAVGISHGALHPRDILVSADDTRLTGVGIAQSLERVGFVVPLRRPYSAPERIDHQEWGRGADLFALAAITYELVTGRRIAGAGSETADALSTVPGLDVEMAQAVFARALAVDPDRRFETALQFVEALKHASDQGAGRDAAARGARALWQAEEEPRLPLEGAQAAQGGALPAADSAAHDLASAEATRYRDVESSPMPPAEPPSVVGDLPLGGAGLDASAGPQATPAFEAASANRRPIDATERPSGVAVAASGAVPPARAQSRRTVWPFILMLVVGFALGFAAGYGAGNRGPASAPVAASPQADQAAGTTASTSGNAAPASPSDAATPPLPPADLPTGSQAAPAGAGSSPTTSATAGSAQAAPRQSAAAALAAPQSGTGRETAGASAAPAEGSDEADGAGRILIRSTPDGARVYVDGRERGRTPVAVRDLSRGSHRVRIVHDGYLMAERRVVITSRRRSISLEVPLEKTVLREPPARPAAATFIGTLVIESRPNGAKVYVDGHPVGTTPMQVPGVSAGSHVVWLDHEGYRRWSSAVRVVSGERNRVTASLEK